MLHRQRKNQELWIWILEQGVVRCKSMSHPREAVRFTKSMEAWGRRGWPGNHIVGADTAYQVFLSWQAFRYGRSWLEADFIGGTAPAISLAIFSNSYRAWNSRMFPLGFGDFFGRGSSNRSRSCIGVQIWLELNCCNFMVVVFSLARVWATLVAARGAVVFECSIRCRGICNLQDCVFDLDVLCSYSGSYGTESVLDCISWIQGVADVVETIRTGRTGEELDPCLERLQNLRVVSF